MDDSRDLRARVDALERAIFDLQRGLEEVRAAIGVRSAVPGAVPIAPVVAPAAPPVGSAVAAQQVAPLPAPTALPPPPPPLPRKPVTGADIVRGGERWFSRLGIGLLLLGLAFLFNYAIDQGWVTPAVRVGIGLLTGVVLLGLGLWLRRSRFAFSQVLQGGGVAAFYISIFAAFQLYELVSYPLAFGAMCLVTLLSFGLAVWQDSLALALIAALGGLGTPFLLYTGSGGALGLVGYTVLLLTGIVAICLSRRWRPLLWVGAVGGWLVLLIAGISLPSLPAGQIDRWAVQGGVVWMALLFWPLLVLLRPATPAEGGTAPSWSKYAAPDLVAMTLGTPFFALLLTGGTWDLSQSTAGWITLALAAATSAGAWLIHDGRDGALVRYGHGLAALLLFTLALLLLLEGNPLLLALAAEGFAVHLWAGRRRDWVVALFGHLLFGVLALVVLGRILIDEVGSPVLVNPPALTNLAITGALFAAAWVLFPKQVAPGYWLAAHVLLLAIIARELLALENGNGYVTLTWGIYAGLLLLVGLRRDITAATLFALGTLLLVVAKLFLIDLAAVAAIWRILLFLGFGSAFLLLGYFLRALWRPRAQSPE